MKPDPDIIQADPELRELFKDVSELAQPGGRPIGSQGHKRASQYLEHRMLELGLEPYAGGRYRMKYRVQLQRFWNLAGMLTGEEGHRPIMLVAHYDTCGPQPGADDNAAAIAVLFQLVKRLRHWQLRHPVLILIPDAEEPPCFLTRRMGSTHFYEKQLNDPLHASVVLDLVGHDIPVQGLSNAMLAFGIESAAGFTELLDHVPAQTDMEVYGLNTSHVGDLSDYHILRKRREPFLFFTCGRWEHYHAESDTPEKLNYDKMQRFVRYLEFLVLELDKRQVERGGVDDTSEFEIRTLRRMLGPSGGLNDIELNNQADVARTIQRFHREFHL